MRLVAGERVDKVENRRRKERLGISKIPDKERRRRGGLLLERLV